MSHKIVAPAACADLLLLAKELSRFHLAAERLALLFLAVASVWPADCLQRQVVSFSTILLQSISCLKSILPLSDDNLKINAGKKIPVFMPV